MILINFKPALININDRGTRYFGIKNSRITKMEEGNRTRKRTKVPVARKRNIINSFKEGVTAKKRSRLCIPICLTSQTRTEKHATLFPPPPPRGFPLSARIYDDAGYRVAGTVLPRNLSLPPCLLACSSSSLVPLVAAAAGSVQEQKPMNYSHGSARGKIRELRQ